MCVERSKECRRRLPRPGVVLLSFSTCPQTTGESREQLLYETRSIQSTDYTMKTANYVFNEDQSVAWWVVAVSSVGRRFAAVQRFIFPGLHVRDESAFFYVSCEITSLARNSRVRPLLSVKRHLMTLHPVLRTIRSIQLIRLLFPRCYCQEHTTRVFLLLGLLLCCGCRAKISWNACKREALATLAVRSR